MRCYFFLPLLAIGAVAQPVSDPSDSSNNATGSEPSMAAAQATGTAVYATTNEGGASTGTSPDATATNGTPTSLDELAITRTTYPTVTTIIGLDDDNNSFNASVVGVDSKSTTVAVNCDTPDGDILNANSATSQRFCLGGRPITFTYGPSGLRMSAVITSMGVTVAMSSSCLISGYTEMTCTESSSVKALGVAATSSSDISTYSTALPSNRVTLTAGVEKLNAATTAR